jgi:hypothetical protein
MSDATLTQLARQKGRSTAYYQWQRLRDTTGGAPFVDAAGITPRVLNQGEGVFWKADAQRPGRLQMISAKEAHRLLAKVNEILPFTAENGDC